MLGWPLLETLVAAAAAVDLDRTAEVRVVGPSLGMVLPGLVEGFVPLLSCLAWWLWFGMVGDESPLSIVAVVVGRQCSLKALALRGRCWRERLSGRRLHASPDVLESGSPAQPLGFLAPTEFAPQLLNIGFFGFVGHSL